MSNPENHNLRRKTAMKIELEFNRKKMHSFFADNKRQVEHFRRKIEAKFKRLLFIQKSNTFKSQICKAQNRNED